MKSNKNSPNWYWEQLGFSVFKNEDGSREILDKDKCLFCKSAGHSVENYLGEYEYRTTIGDVSAEDRVATGTVVKDYKGSSKIKLSTIAQGAIDRLINSII